jgi:spore germination protein YaaH
MTGRRPRRHRAAVALAGLLAAATVPVAGAERSSAAPAPTARFVTGWLPYYGVTDGTRALNAGSDAAFAEVSPFAYSAAGASDLRVVGGASALAAALAAANAKHLPIVPTITDGTGKGVMAGILDDPINRAAHVQALVDLTTSQSYDGIDLDYEGFAFTDGRATWPTTQPDWVAFVTLLGTQLHAAGKLLSVTVPAIWDGGASGYTVYDWPDIIASVDRLRVMTYDWSTSKKGPIAPISWDQNVLAYIAKVIPAEQLSKVQLGVPAYGRSWAEVTRGQCPANASIATQSVQMENVAALASAHGATPVRDVSGELTFGWDQTFTGSQNSVVVPPDYIPPTVYANTLAPADDAALKPALRILPPGATVTCTVHRTVFVPDAQSVKDRAVAALNAGISGIAIWALGYETPDVWTQLLAVDGHRPAGTAPIGDLNTVQAQGSAVYVVGWALDPEFDLPVTVQVSVNGGTWSGPIIARNRRDDVATNVAGADPLHGFEASVPIPTSPGDTVCVRATGWGASAVPTNVACKPATA